MVDEQQVPQSQSSDENRKEEVVPVEVPTEPVIELPKLPFWLRSKLALMNALPKKMREKREKKILDDWRASIIAQEAQLMELANSDREKAVGAILMFNAVYVLEDEEGKELTQERLIEMPHQEVLDILEQYLDEMRKDIGGVVEQ